MSATVLPPKEHQQMQHECLWYIHTMEYYSVIKKNEIMPFAATWVDLEMIILSEVSQTEKDKYHDITYMWNLKKMIQRTYLQNRNRLIDRRKTYGYQRGQQGWRRDR